MFLGLLPGGVFFNYGGAECSLLCPSQAGTEGFEEHCRSPQIRMSIHPVSSLVRPGIWRKRGSQAGFGWKLIFPRRQGEGRQRKEQPSALFNNTSKRTDNILYLAVSWKRHFTGKTQKTNFSLLSSGSALSSPYSPSLDG